MTKGKGIKNKTYVLIAVIGTLVNFALFAVKLYVGVSTNSLSIYCDAINNLGDTVSGIIASVGFATAIKLQTVAARRAQSLATFVIGIILALTGAYFAYNGLERLMYPTPVSYLKKYALLIGVTALVKVAMAVFYFFIYRRGKNVVIKTLLTDSILDTGITCATLMSLYLVQKINYAVDGYFAIALGLVIAISAIKTVVGETRFLINGDSAEGENTASLENSENTATLGENANAEPAHIGKNGTENGENADSDEENKFSPTV